MSLLVWLPYLATQVRMWRSQAGVLRRRSKRATTNLRKRGGR